MMLHPAVGEFLLPKYEFIVVNPGVGHKYPDGLMLESTMFSAKSILLSDKIIGEKKQDINITKINIATNIKENELKRLLNIIILLTKFNSPQYIDYFSVSFFFLKAKNLLKKKFNIITIIVIITLLIK